MAFYAKEDEELLELTKREDMDLSVCILSFCCNVNVHYILFSFLPEAGMNSIQTKTKATSVSDAKTTSGKVYIMSSFCWYINRCEKSLQTTKFQIKNLLLFGISFP